MKIDVIGAGAVGLGIGCGLATGDIDLRFVANSAEQSDALRKNGVTRTGIFGDLHARPDHFHVTTRLGDLALSPADYWLVCVKATESENLARELVAVWRQLDHFPAVVLCQNGWGNAEIFSRFLPRDHIFNARVITGFEREGPAQVRVTVHADAIHIGSLFASDVEALRPLCEAIARGGVPCELSDDIVKDLWAKVLYNDLLNPLGALVGVPYGTLGERTETRSIMRGLAVETFAVMHAAGYSTHWASADAYLETFYAKLLPPTAEHQSSMLQDLRAGRPTEIDPLCGAICELAEQSGIDAPLNRALFTLIRAAELRRQPSS